MSRVTIGEEVTKEECVSVTMMKSLKNSPFAENDEISRKTGKSDKCGNVILN